MKIFKLNEADWVAAETLEDAKKCLSKLVYDGTLDDEFEKEYIDTPYELSEEAMNRIKMTDEDGYWEMNRKADADTSGKSWDEFHKEYLESCPTFKQELEKRIAAGDEFPQHFATSEY